MSAGSVRTKVIQTVIVFAVLVLCPGRAAAQFETSAVVGTIVDTQSAAVAGVKVTLTNSATGVSSTTMTDAPGSFEFFTVRLGTYVVTAEKAGFSIALADNVQVSIGTRRRVDLTLEVGGLTETVEAVGNLPRSTACMRVTP